MTEADLRLDKYGISRDLYRELKWFCRQYRAKLSEVNSCRELCATANDGMPRASGVSDPTARKAERAIFIRRDIATIEQAAIATDSVVYQHIIKHVVDGIPIHMLAVPCGERQFKQMRRIFFWELANRLGKL